MKHHQWYLGYVLKLVKNTFYSLFEVIIPSFLNGQMLEYQVTNSDSVSLNEYSPIK